MRHPGPGADPAAGISIVAISGNHDSAPRLGAFADFLAAGGLHLRTAAAGRRAVVLIDDPTVRSRSTRFPTSNRTWPAVSGTCRHPRSHQQVLTRALRRTPRGPRVPAAGHPVGGAGARLRDRRGGRWVRTVDRRRGSRVGHRRRLRRVRLRRPRAPARQPAGRPTASGTPVRRCPTPSPRPDRPRACCWSTSTPSGDVDVHPLDLPVIRRLATVRGTLAEILAGPQQISQMPIWRSS